MTQPTLYERLGERDGIRAVVDDFYDRLLDDETLAPFFSDADVDRLRRTQTDFLCEAAGGPETYDAEPVREAHLHVPFTESHIERALDHLTDSLDSFDVPAADAEAVVGVIAGYREELLARPEEERDERESGQL
ncbi:globin domain-containing protein [Halobellus sp. GM3]|uniref:globin domain-containing protein n=1 Tax=Halobellus sp. GM3 TaxID=3458410 RepID=UPI00403E0F84